jgi:hypothetical protein
MGKMLEQKKYYQATEHLLKRREKQENLTIKIQIFLLLNNQKKYLCAII